MKYRKKPVVIEATQWFKNGDHPEVERYLTSPDACANEYCLKCMNPMENHGWIDTLEGGHIVCPGDFIITGVQGEQYPCKPDIFQETYEPVGGEDDG